MIAGLDGRLNFRTLENFCHNRPDGCPLFDTKPENTPVLLFSAIETAEDLRELKEINLLPGIEKLTAWEVCCYRAAEASARKIEAEITRESTENSGEKSRIGSDLGKFEEDGAFAKWDELAKK